MLHRVREQVREHAHDQAVIDEHCDVLRQRALELDPLRERFGHDLRDAALGERRERDDLGHRLELALLHLVHVQ